MFGAQAASRGASIRLPQSRRTRPTAPSTRLPAACQGRSRRARRAARSSPRTGTAINVMTSATNGKAILRCSATAIRDDVEAADPQRRDVAPQAGEAEALGVGLLGAEVRRRLEAPAACASNGVYSVTTSLVKRRVQPWSASHVLSAAWNDADVTAMRLGEPPRLVRRSGRPSRLAQGLGRADRSRCSDRGGRRGRRPIGAPSTSNVRGAPPRIRCLSSAALRFEAASTDSSSPNSMPLQSSPRTTQRQRRAIEADAAGAHHDQLARLGQQADGHQGADQGRERQHVVDELRRRVAA